MPGNNAALDIRAPYAPRPIRFRGLRRHGDWRLKEYTIVYGDGRLNEADYAAGLPGALAALPSPAVEPQRPGVGFLIVHQGRGATYIVLAWWDNENELPLRVFVRNHDEAAWRPAAGSESVCVWDLLVIAFERDAYVRCVLSSAGGPDAYLAAQFSA